jgi:hypothetical protein
MTFGSTWVMNTIESGLMWLIIGTPIVLGVTFSLYFLYYRRKQLEYTALLTSYCSSEVGNRALKKLKPYLEAKREFREFDYQTLGEELIEVADRYDPTLLPLYR